MPASTSPVDIGILISLATFVLGYVIKFIAGAVNDRRKRARLLTALAAEIQLNLDLLVDGIVAFPDFHAISAFMAEKGGNAPHMIFTYHSDVYRSNIGLLSDLQAVVIKNTVAFYGSLDYIDKIVASLEKPSFRIVSDRGRDNVMMGLKEEIELARLSGRNLLDAYRLILPRAGR